MEKGIVSVECIKSVCTNGKRIRKKKKSKCQIYLETTRHDGKLSLILQSEYLTSIVNGPEPLFAKLRKTIIRFFVIKRSTVVFQ